MYSASCRAILLKCFYQFVAWFCAIFLYVLFHTLFATMKRIRCKQQFVVKMEKKKLTAGFVRDAKVEGWRAMSEEEKYFWNYQIFFLWSNYLLFSQQSCDCAPLICKNISCISELLHRTLHVGCHVAGLIIPVTT